MQKTILHSTLLLPELAGIIFHYLDFQTLVFIMQRVCKAWQALACVQLHQVDLHFVQQHSLCGITFAQDKLPFQSMGPLYPLEKSRIYLVRKSDCSDAQIDHWWLTVAKSLVHKCYNLQRLRLCCANITNEQLLMLRDVVPRLQELKLMRCYHISDSAFCQLVCSIMKELQLGHFQCKKTKCGMVLLVNR